MITEELLRDWIGQADAWQDLRDALDLEIEPDELQRSANKWQVMNAYGPASIASETLRQKLHRYPMPVIELAPYSEASLLYHLQSGLTNAREISEYMAEHFASPSRRLAVLDFGCGMCRILRYLMQFVPQHVYYACDVNDPAIQWDRRTFLAANFLRIGAEPPVRLPDASMDVIYAFSIFTHYSEAVHLRWMEDLARLLKPGGLLIVTIHGDIILNRMAKEHELQHGMRLEGRGIDVAALHDTFRQRGYGFYECYNDAGAGEYGIDPSLFGMAFISPDYVRERWGPRFELLKHEPGKVFNWQDYALLRRK